MTAVRLDKGLQLLVYLEGGANVGGRVHSGPWGSARDSAPAERAPDMFVFTDPGFSINNSTPQNMHRAHFLSRRAAALFLCLQSPLQLPISH